MSQDLKEMPEVIYVYEPYKFRLAEDRADTDVGYIRADIANARVTEAAGFRADKIEEAKILYAIASDPSSPLTTESLFIAFFHAMQYRVHHTAVSHGWWENDRNDGECIALIHTELSEALEELRTPSSHIHTNAHRLAIRKNIALEFADVIIRVMDFCEARGYDIASAIVEKNEINKARPYKHGKKF